MLLLLIVICFGFGLIYALPKSLGAISKILLFPALGILMFTQILLFLAFILGTNVVSIALSLAVFLIISLVFYLKLRAPITISKSGLGPYIFILVISMLFGFLWLKQTLFYSEGMLWTGGGGMYGDTALHASYTSRLLAGEFPPQNPLFAGHVLVYPFANDLFSAALLKNGLDFNLAFSLPQIIFLIAFLVLFYEVSQKFTGIKGFVASFIILFLGWGVGGFIFLGHWLSNLNDFWGLLKIDVTNNPDTNLYFHNIVTGLILPERSFLPGLVLGLLFFLNFWEYYHSRRNWSLIFNGIILGILPFWHTHTFIYFSIFGLIVSFWLLYKERSKTNLFMILLMFALAFIISIPFLILFFSNHSTQRFISITAGWQNNGQNLILFWFRNSFLVIPLALVGMLFVSRPKKIFLISAIVVFIVANFVIFQPWSWDNIKLLSWSFVFFSVLAAVALGKLKKFGHMGNFLIVCILALSSVSGILSIANQVKNQFVIYDKQDIALGNWIKANTQPSDVFIAEPTPNSPIPSLGQRMLYLGYPGHLWVHGINYSVREQMNTKIVNGDWSNINNLDTQVSYVVVSVSGYKAVASPFLEVFLNTKYKVFKVN